MLKMMKKKMLKVSLIDEQLGLPGYVCVEELERKTVSKRFALFIALLLPSPDMCGYPFNSGQKKSIYQVQNGE